MLSSYVKENHRTWDEYLPSIACAIRRAKHETTGFTHFFINFGREHIINCKFYSERISDEENLLDAERRQQGFRDLYGQVKQILLLSRLRNDKYYNLRRRPM